MLLLNGLAKYRLHDNGPLILDGHFALLEPGGTFAEIPMAVFNAIAPVAVILIEAAPETVHSRLLDSDREALPIPAIAELSMRERLHAERVCEHLKLSLKTLSTDGAAAEAVANATSLIRSILEERP
jgi:adenylate kinase